MTPPGMACRIRKRTIVLEVAGQPAQRGDRGEAEHGPDVEPAQSDPVTQPRTGRTTTPSHRLYDVVIHCA